MALAQQTHWLMEQNIKCGNKPTILWSINISRAGKEYKIGKKSLQQMVPEKLDSYMRKNET